MIPRRLIRIVPETTTDAVETWWKATCALNANWSHVELRDPIDLSDYPRTAALVDRCTTGAQFAGVLRLEELYLHGGVYVDSDWEGYRPFESLLRLAGFAGYEDPWIIPDAVLGFEARHPALLECLDLVPKLIGDGAWASGPGVTTTVLPKYPEILLLPPQALYPYHWSEKQTRRDEDHRKANPWAFGAHHWNASWLP